MGKVVEGVKEVGRDIDPTYSKGELGSVTKPVTDLTLLFNPEGVGDELENAYGELTGKDEEEAMKAALAEQQASQADQLAFLKEQYGDITAALSPYREAGETFLPQLQEMLSPEARSEYIANYLQGDEYQQLQQQASNQLLQSAAATGSLGASGTQDRLARQSLQMGSQLGGQAYNSALGNLLTGTNLGFGTFGTQIQAQNQLNQGTQAGLQNMGNLAFQQASIGQGGILGDLMPLIQTGASIYGAG